MIASITLLAENDYVGMTFWLATAIMLASTVFFFIERSDVSGKWRTSMTVAGLVTGIAFWHYLYMREAHLQGEVTTVFRYIDWANHCAITNCRVLLDSSCCNSSNKCFILAFVGCIISYVGIWFLRRSRINGCYCRLYHWYGRLDIYHI